MGFQLFAPEFVCRHYESALSAFVWNVDHAQIPTAARLAKRHPRVVGTWPVFPRMGEDLANFNFGNAMVVDVRFARLRIVVEAEFLTRASLPFPF
jgi:hypothetical protein